jgi:hypothetical protein
LARGDFVTEAVNRPVPGRDPTGIGDGEISGRMELENRGFNSVRPLLPAILSESSRTNCLIVDRDGMVVRKKRIPQQSVSLPFSGQRADEKPYQHTVSSEPATRRTEQNRFTLGEFFRGSCFAGPTRIGHSCETSPGWCQLPKAICARAASALDIGGHRCT